MQASPIMRNIWIVHSQASGHIYGVFDSQGKAKKYLIDPLNTGLTVFIKKYKVE